jgi:pimeloyl-ACP methyl ester carboxylesterase
MRAATVNRPLPNVARLSNVVRLPWAIVCAAALSAVVGPAGAAGPTDTTIRSADGVPIHFRAEGGGAPPLVFVHGWSCDATYWEHQIHKFRKDHRVIAIDLAGHGTSGAGRTNWSIPAFAEDVRAVLEAEDLRDAILIGHSMSGYVIVETARLVPGRVLGLVPVDSLLNIEWNPDPDAVAALLDSMTRDFKGAAAAFVRDMFPEGADSDLVARIVAGMSAAPPDVAIPALRAVFAFDIAGSITQVRQPIRAINALRHPTLVEVNQRYAPRFEVALMDGVGHFPMLEDPKRFNRILGQTVAGLWAARPSASPKEGAP